MRAESEHRSWARSSKKHTVAYGVYQTHNRTLHTAAAATSQSPHHLRSGTAVLPSAVAGLVNICGNPRATRQQVSWLLQDFEPLVCSGTSDQRELPQVSRSGAT